MTTSLASTKVLVTGANGFIGLHTTLHLLQLGYRVRGTVRTEVHAESSLATRPGLRTPTGAHSAPLTILAEATLIVPMRAWLTPTVG
jgi:nucleoside-diphosphate-sugar epimerase